MLGARRGRRQAAGFGFLDGGRGELEVPVGLVLDDDYVVLAADGVDFLLALDG